MSGDIGPCGPSVRILFDFSDSEDNTASVPNINDDRLLRFGLLCLCRLSSYFLLMIMIFCIHK